MNIAYKAQFIECMVAFIDMFGYKDRDIKSGIKGSESFLIVNF